MGSDAYGRTSEERPMYAIGLGPRRLLVGPFGPHEHRGELCSWVHKTIGTRYECGVEVGVGKGIKIMGEIQLNFRLEEGIPSRSSRKR